MVGGILIVVLLVLAFPIGFLMSTAVGAAVLGKFLNDDAAERHEGSELLDLNT